MPDLPTALSNIQSKLDESHASGVKVERGDLEVVMKAARDLSPMPSVKLEGPLPAPEGDSDGYLTDEWLESFQAWDATFYDAPGFWLETFPAAVKCLSCARLEMSVVDDDVRGRGHLVTFATGGWSGAEELIEIALSKWWLGRHHRLWQSGGYYEFFVSDNELNAARGQATSKPAAVAVGDKSRAEKP